MHCLFSKQAAAPEPKQPSGPYLQDAVSGLQASILDGSSAGQDVFDQDGAGAVDWRISGDHSEAETLWTYIGRKTHTSDALLFSTNTQNIPNRYFSNRPLDVSAAGLKEPDLQTPPSTKPPQRDFKLLLRLQHSVADEAAGLSYCKCDNLSVCVSVYVCGFKPFSQRQSNCRSEGFKKKKKVHAWGREESKEHEGKDKAKGINWNRVNALGREQKKVMQMCINLLVNTHTWGEKKKRKDLHWHWGQCCAL